MYSELMFLLCCGFIAWLFREDMKWRRLESGALWIAGFSIAISGSRSVTYWTVYLGLGGGVDSNVEGSPVNFVIAMALIGSALFVLRKREINWSAVVRANKTLFFVYFFFAASALWA